MAKKVKKTNVMRLLDQHHIDYEGQVWENIFGTENEKRAYKTLVTENGSRTYYVFVVPKNWSLDLKKAANAVGEKSIHMLKQKDLFPLTGYVHGGVSPIGMKKTFTTVIDASALTWPKVFMSAGKLGEAIELEAKNLEELLPVTFQDIASEEPHQRI